MSPYRNLHVPNLSEIQEAVAKFITPEMLINPRIVKLENYHQFTQTDSIIKLLNSYNLSIDGAVFLPQVVRPFSEGHIHIDTGPSKYSINLPIKNCANTNTQFFESEIAPKLSIDKECPFLKLEPELCNLIYSIESNKPYIINTQVPHRAKNNTPFFRMNLLIRHSDISRMSEIFLNS